MKLMNRVVKSVCAVAFCAAIGVGVMAVSETPAEAAAECICLHIWAPVTCDGGVVFSNQCFANCAGATGCVPGIPY